MCKMQGNSEGQVRVSVGAGDSIQAAAARLPSGLPELLVTTLHDCNLLTAVAR